VQPIGTLLGMPIPSDPASLALGLLATTVGLLAGWCVPAARLLGPLFAPALAGFRLDGGFAGLVVRPALSLAAAADRADSVIHRTVLDVGRAALRIAGAARSLDERGIDRLIAALVAGIRALSGRVRALQGGLVSRELLITVGGIATFVALLLVIR
jgi:NADH-quinone oxidoreductase subunit L